MSVKENLYRLYAHPAPVHYLLGKAIGRLGLLSYPERVRFNAEGYPQYAHCILHAARLAEALNYPKMSVVEFGVAGGNGLVMAEHHAAKASVVTGVDIEVYGFDTGEGLPQPKDYRDIPYIWKTGYYKMDQKALARRLSRARLVLGNVDDTIDQFVRDGDFAPIGCLFHDLDFFSSTTASFRILDAPASHRLPRIFNYFDDINGSARSLYCDQTGERAAIQYYNRNHELQKFSQAYYLQDLPQFPYYQRIFIHHDFEHSHYSTYVGRPDMQSPLV